MFMCLALVATFIQWPYSDLDSEFHVYCESKHPNIWNSVIQFNTILWQMKSVEQPSYLTFTPIFAWQLTIFSRPILLFLVLMSSQVPIPIFCYVVRHAVCVFVRCIFVSVVCVCVRVCPWPCMRLSLSLLKTASCYRKPLLSKKFLLGLFPMKLLKYRSLRSPNYCPYHQLQYNMESHLST